jgi:hypothetical protein
MTTSHFSRRAVLTGMAAMGAGVAVVPAAVASAGAPLVRPRTTGGPGGIAGSALEYDAAAYVQLEPEFLGVEKATYPRVKLMSDGRYLLIYQDAQIGWDIYWTTSSDLTDWSEPEVLFESYKIPDDCNHPHACTGTDDVCFSTADAVVLDNGEILAVCSYRASKNFYYTFDMSGLIMRRSQDHGQTWSEPEIVYVGPTWEPYVTQLRSGEVQIYFTHIAPKMAIENTAHSSGVGLLRSFDGGATWTPNVTGYPFEAQRIAQLYRKDSEDGVKMFSDQMPTIIETGARGEITLAVETKVGEDPFHVSLIHTDANWPDHLGIDEEGPADRENRVFVGAAPYLGRFPTGETVLVYNTSSRQHVRLGDSEARSFGEPQIFLPGRGFWGTVEVVGPRTALISMQSVRTAEGKANAIMIGTIRLNRAISAEIYPADGAPSWDGDGGEIFLGGIGPAQVRVSAARAGNTLTLRVERRGGALQPGDLTSIYLASRRDPAQRLQIAIDHQGEVDAAAAEAGVSAQTVSDSGDSRVWEVQVPLGQLRPTGWKLGIGVELVSVSAEGTTVELLHGMSVDDSATWLDLSLAGG